jgi:hypothetical protein
VFVRVRAGDHLTADRLNDKTVARTVKKWAAKVGVDPTG